METMSLTLMIISLLSVFAVDILQKRHNDLNKGK